MEINKQLFEDVLSGKLKGMFVLKCGIKTSSDELSFNNDYDKEKYPYKLWKMSYTSEGYFHVGERTGGLSIIDFIPDTDKIEIDAEMCSYNEKDIQFIKYFINGYHMKENELTIEIPEGKIVDWEESKKQNKIVFKNRHLTYKDICEKLFDGKRICYIHSDGTINILPFSEMNTSHIADTNNALTHHQLECILAKNQLATVAKYLNDGWKPDKCSDIYYINNYHGNLVVYLNKETCSVYMGQVIFKTKELAEKAIEILGEETVKLALEPLGI